MESSCFIELVNLIFLADNNCLWLLGIPESK